jgi:ribosomal protein S24E
MSILSDEENKTLNRREIEFAVVQEASTESREEIKIELCKKLNLNPDCTVISTIHQEFGMRRSRGTAHSYKSKEEMGKTEPKYLIDRLSKKNKDGSGAAKPEEAASEKK